MGVHIELRKVSSCDVCQGVYWAKVVDPLLIDRYICCWKICMKSDSQQFILIPVLQVFNNFMVWFAFPH